MTITFKQTSVLYIFSNLKDLNSRMMYLTLKLNHGIKVFKM